MARYIDADLFKANANPVWYLVDGYCGLYDKNDIEDMIDAQPTADVQEVKHGHWKLNGTRLCECSVCGVEGNTSGHDNYCWNCGARMDEEVE